VTLGVTRGGQGRMAVIPETGPALGDRAARALQLIGAGASVALVIGGVVWGYQLLVRDVTGLPVVRAMEGPMRLAPAEEEIGGAIAEHEGLAVNAIAAEGAATDVSGVLHIAPGTAGLTEEDMDVALVPGAEADDAALVTAAPQPALATETLAPAADGPLTADEILALADEIAAGTPPLAAIEAPQVAVIPAEVPGLARAILPQSRPGGLSAPAPAAAPAPVADVAVATAALTSGTVFAQFGVYDSAAAAAADWDRLAGQFGPLLSPYARLIEGAESNGSPFFRLRAVNFAALDDARRLCSAMEAANTPCIFAEAP
jgi:hypothetical protein